MEPECVSQFKWAWDSADGVTTGRWRLCWDRCVTGRLAVALVAKRDQDLELWHCAVIDEPRDDTEACVQDALRDALDRSGDYHRALQLHGDARLMAAVGAVLVIMEDVTREDNLAKLAQRRRDHAERQYHTHRLSQQRAPRPTTTQHCLSPQRNTQCNQPRARSPGQYRRRNIVVFNNANVHKPKAKSRSAH